MASRNSINNESTACLPPAIWNNLYLFSLSILTTILLSTTICLSQLTFSSGGSGSIWEIPFSWSLAMLRILQGMTSSTTTLTVAQAFEVVQWTLLIGRSSPLPTFLTLAGSTGMMGLLRLGTSRKSSLSQRIWTATRYESSYPVSSRARHSLRASDFSPR